MHRKSMEQEVLNNFQKLQLTQEEADDIFITSITMKTVWKMGLDLWIVEVGNNVFQFKFGSVCQLEWVERSGPWSFDNNLLLLCRWWKGLTASNIVFTHAPFWVQIWGLPFEYMSEDAGKDIGSKLGKVLEMDKRSLQAEQAKFMRIRVEIPIDKPLRRGGNITNTEGERCSIIFTYERLPTFCYICGILGHDEKHCHVSPMEGEVERQYGDWLRAGGVLGYGIEKGRSAKGGSSEGVEGDRTNFQARGSVAKPCSLAVSKENKSWGQNSNNGLSERRAGDFENLTKDLNPILSVGDGLNGWDKADGEPRESQVGQGTRLKEKGICLSLVGEQLKPGEEATSASFLKKDGPCIVEP